MGLLDKIKNLFTDEEEIFEEEEIEVEEKKPKRFKIEKKVEKQEKVEKIEKIEKKEKEENQLPTFMREKIEKEEREKQEFQDNIFEFSEVNLTRESREVKESNNFKFPIVFDETDFEPPIVQAPPVIEKPKEEKKTTTLYNGSKNNSKKEVKKFKPTPIISPVYGILDKNYKTDEVKAKPENTYQIPRPSSKKVDFESVRMKAYGTLTDEINSNLLSDDLIDDTNVEVIDPSNLVLDVTIDKDTTIENAEENYYDFGVNYEIPNRDTRITVPDDTIIEDDIKIVNHNEEEVKAEKIEVKEEPTEELRNTVVEDTSKESDLELTEDLFSLIDAMYDERNDDE